MSTSLLRDIKLFALPRLSSSLSVRPPSEDGGGMSVDEEGEKGGDVEGELGEEELEEQEGEVRRYPREKPHEGLYTAQEEADLRECLRSTSIPEEAVARFKKMHPQCRTVTTYVRKHKDRFRNDHPKKVLGGAWKEVEDAALVHLLSLPRVSRRAAFVRFAKEHPTRTHKSAEGRYALRKEWFEAAIEKKKAELASQPFTSATPAYSTFSFLKASLPDKNAVAFLAPKPSCKPKPKPKSFLKPTPQPAVASSSTSKPAPSRSPSVAPSKRPGPSTLSLEGRRLSPRTSVPSHLSLRPASPSSNHSSPVFGSARLPSLPTLPSLTFSPPPPPIPYLSVTPSHSRPPASPSSNHSSPVFPSTFLPAQLPSVACALPSLPVIGPVAAASAASAVMKVEG